MWRCSLLGVHCRAASLRSVVTARERRMLGVPRRSAKEERMSPLVRFAAVAALTTAFSASVASQPRPMAPAPGPGRRDLCGASASRRIRCISPLKPSGHHHLHQLARATATISPLATSSTPRTSSPAPARSGEIELLPARDQDRNPGAARGRLPCPLQPLLSRDAGHERPDHLRRLSIERRAAYALVQSEAEAERRHGESAS